MSPKRIAFSCPACQQRIDATPEMLGTSAPCPACGTPIIFPAPITATVVPDEATFEPINPVVAFLRRPLSLPSGFSVPMWGVVVVAGLVLTFGGLATGVLRQHDRAASTKILADSQNLGAGDMAGRIMAADAAVAADPTNPEAYALRARCRKVLGLSGFLNNRMGLAFDHMRLASRDFHTAARFDDRYSNDANEVDTTLRTWSIQSGNR